MLIKVTDTAGTSGTITVDSHDLAETITPWYPEAPAEVYTAIDDLQAAILRGDHTQHDLATYLALEIQQA